MSLKHLNTALDLDQQLRTTDSHEMFMDLISILSELFEPHFPIKHFIEETDTLHTYSSDHSIAIIFQKDAVEVLMKAAQLDDGVNLSCQILHIKEDAESYNSPNLMEYKEMNNYDTILYLFENGMLENNEIQYNFEITLPN